MLTLSLSMGKNFSTDNLTNMVSCLFMWALLPAFGAASYVPAIVLGAADWERHAQARGRTHTRTAGAQASRRRPTCRPARVLSACCVCCPAFHAERRLFLRERADGLYHVFTYLASKLLEEILLALVITLAFSAFVFHGVRLQGEWVVFW